MEWWRVIILTLCMIGAAVIGKMLAEDFLERENKGKEKKDKE